MGERYCCAIVTGVCGGLKRVKGFKQAGSKSRGQREQKKLQREVL